MLVQSAPAKHDYRYRVLQCFNFLFLALGDSKAGAGSPKIICREYAGGGNRCNSVCIEQGTVHYGRLRSFELKRAQARAKIQLICKRLTQIFSKLCTALSKLLESSALLNKIVQPIRVIFPCNLPQSP